MKTVALFLVGLFLVGRVEAGNNCRPAAVVNRTQVSLQTSFRSQVQRPATALSAAVAIRKAAPAVDLQLDFRRDVDEGVSYGAGYREPDASAELALVLRELSGRIGRIEQQLANGNGGIMPPANGNGASRGRSGEPFHETQGRAACIACHANDVARTKGGGLALFDAGGKWREPDAATVGRIVLEVSEGRMPRGGKMDEATRLKFIASVLSK